MGGIHPQRFAAGEIRRTTRVGGQALEDAGLFLPVAEHGPRGIIHGAPFFSGSHGHQTVRVGIGQGTEHYRVHQAENGRIGADSESQRR